MIRRLFIAALCCFAFSAFGQTLTAAQLVTMRAGVCADNSAKALLLAGDSAGLRTYMNAASTFVVWKSSVTIRETGQNFDGAEWAGMTSANHTRLQTVAQYLMVYSPAVAGIRAMFNDIWSGAGGTNTRAALLALWKRFATRTEQVFATGTGSDATPGLLVFEGTLSATDSTRTIFNDNGTIFACP